MSSGVIRGVGMVAADVTGSQCAGALLGLNGGRVEKSYATGAAWPAFSDDPLVPGATPLRAAHLLELRSRIDGLRRRAGLPAFGWTDAQVVPGVTPARAVHLTELRSALGEAYAAAGRSAPGYTDAVATPGMTGHAGRATAGAAGGGRGPGRRAGPHRTMRQLVADPRLAVAAVEVTAPQPGHGVCAHLDRSDRLTP